MKRITITMIVLVTIFMTACETTEKKEDQFELIGDTLVVIERETEYVDQGVLFNGNKVSPTVVGEVDSSVIGDYVITYEYKGLQLERTVSVVTSVEDQYTEIIEMFHSIDNISINSDIQVEYTVMGTTQGGLSLQSDIDVYEDIWHCVSTEDNNGVLTETTYYLEQVPHEGYQIQYIDLGNGVYQISSNTIDSERNLISDFDITKYKSVSMEEEDGLRIFYVTLASTGFEDVYHMLSMYLFGSSIPVERTDTMEIEVWVVNDTIYKIKANMTDILNQYYGEDTELFKFNKVDLMLKYEDYQQVAPFELPEKARLSKKLIVPEMNGSGTISDPYQITDAYDLRGIEFDLGAHYVLMNDISLAGFNWESIGDAFAPFVGTLDGAGFTISDLNYIQTTNEPIYGLFHSLSNNGLEQKGMIKNLTLEDVHIEVICANWYARIGTVVGSYNKSTIENVSVSGRITVYLSSNDNSSYISVGGIAGSALYGSVLSNSTSDIELNIFTNVNQLFIGSLVGTENGDIINSTGTGIVSIDEYE